LSHEEADSLGFLDFNADFSASHIVRVYDELPLWSAMFGLLMLEHVPLRAATALDVGCGTGFPLIELAERLGAGSRVDGIDTWKEALDRAREKILARGLSNVSVHRCSAAGMPFGDAVFELIVSNLGLNNFEDRASALRECRRVAKAGAVLAITTNLRGHMREFYVRSKMSCGRRLMTMDSRGCAITSRSARRFRTSHHCSKAADSA